MGVFFSHAHPHTVTKTSWDSWNLIFCVVSSPWQRVYWFNYLKVMCSVCLSTSLPFFLSCLCPGTPMRVSLFQPSLAVSLALCPSVSAAHWDPLPLLLCRHLTFITAWPWLSLLSSLLWCSITLSSWGKHWCQATVMTFWLSVFMWWMRWKCTTTAKRGLALCQAATPQWGRMGAGRHRQQNK